MNTLKWGELTLIEANPLKKLIMLALCFLFAVPAVARDIGVQFSKIPVGTQMFYVGADGDKWTDIYKGVKNGQYLVERRSGHNPNGPIIHREFFDKQGRLVLIRGKRGLRVSYKPFSCLYQYGKCKHTQRIRGAAYVEHGASKSWNVETTFVKGRYALIWTRHKNNGGMLYSLGKYNLRSEVQWLTKKGLRTQKLVKIK